MSHRCGGARPVSDSLTPVWERSALTSECEIQRHRRRTYLLVDTSLLLLDLFFQPSQAGSVRCSTIGFQYLDVPGSSVLASIIQENPESASWNDLHDALTHR